MLSWDHTDSPGGSPLPLHVKTCSFPFQLLLFIYLFIYLFLAGPGLRCGTQDLLVAACGLLVAACELLVAARMRNLVPQPGMEPRPPAVGTWSLTHWTTREVPFFVF